MLLLTFLQRLLPIHSSRGGGLRSTQYCLAATPEGHACYRKLNARLLVIASTMGVALSEANIRKTTEIVRQLNDDVKARSDTLAG
ncbi:MAG: hypothetical protein WAL40_08095 [Rhodoplanes sp.]